MQFSFCTAAQSFRSVPSPARREVDPVPSALRPLRDEIAYVLLPAIHFGYVAPRVKRDSRNLDIRGMIAGNDIPEPEEPTQTSEHALRSERCSDNETPVGHGRPFPK